MFTRKSSSTPLEISGSVFGVHVVLGAANRQLLDSLLEFLPPDWQVGSAGVEPIAFHLTPMKDDQYDLQRNGESSTPVTLEDALRAFDVALRFHIAMNAPGHVFVHAGTAAYGGKAVVIPGPSFSGKTTLISELVKAGATYYSDEYAVIDPDGLVHPYAKPLAVRTDGTNRKRRDKPSDLGATVGVEPVSLSLVLFSQYRRDAVWDPVQMSPAEATIELVRHAFTNEDRAATTLATLSKAAANCTFLSGDRGDASELAPLLLARLDD